VLVEGDDHADPIADAARAILDGHIVLSRQLAESGVYPAIDIEASISRLTPQITTPEHMGMTQNFRGLYSLYQQNRDLISVGAYQPGTDPAIDRAVRMYPQIIDFIRQDMHQSVDFGGSRDQLAQVLSQTGDENQPQVVDTLLEQDLKQGEG